jgi:hypothetical protein
MKRTVILCLSFFLAIILMIPDGSWSQKADTTISDFKVQALYRAAKLTWKARDGIKNPIPVQIMRSNTFEEGPYIEVETLNLSPGKTAYEFVDKSMGSEAKFFYKLIVKDTGESLGPLPTRPFFSPPAT